MTGLASHLTYALTWLVIAVYTLLSFGAPLATALSPEQKAIYDSKINYFDYAVCSGDPTAAADPANQSDPSGSDIKLDDVVQDNNIHSIALRKIGTNQVKNFNATNSPNAVASTLKLIIVDVALSLKVDLSEKVRVEGEVYYGSDDSIHKGDSVSVRDAITAALGPGSSNNGANVIIKVSGGPDAVQDKARQLGYDNTTVTSFFKNTTSLDVKNNSTARDINDALAKIYTGDREGDTIAQTALQKSSSENAGGYSVGSEANKWGLRNNPPVRANAAVFKVGEAKYAITMYTNTTQESNITNATKAILAQLEGTAAASAPSQAETADSEACCVTGQATLLAGNSNEEKIWNYLIQELGLNDIQAAGIMGNVEQESGFSPTALNPSSGAYGIAQWLGGRKTALISFAASKGKPKSDLGVQLDFLKQELENGYKARVLDPIKASSNLAEVTRIWLERFEIPCTPGPACDGEMNIRLPNATKWLNRFGGGSADTSLGGSGETANTGCDTGSGAFSSLNYQGKSELVEKALSNPNIIYGNFGSAATQKDDVRNCLTEPTLVGLISMAEQSGVKIPVNAMATDHGGCTGGSGSLHNSGRAIDIGYYGNGNARHSADGDKLYSYIYRNRKELGVAELIWQDPPNGQKCVKNLEPVDCYITYATVIADHYHHIHVGFK
jgi:hypothetical protein